MAKIYFYDAEALDQEQLNRFLGELRNSSAHYEQPLELANVRTEAEVVSVFVSSSVTEQVMASMPSLRLIACRSTGFNNVDLKAAAKRNIAVVNVPTYGENTVAEYAFGLLLALVRRIPDAIESVKEGETDHADLRGRDLQGKTLGVIGAGHIGCHMAEIAGGFGMKTLAYDPFPDPAKAARFGFAYKPLDTVLKTADFISLHVPYTQETHHLIDTTKLKLIKPGAVVINTARGEVIETAALVEALQAKQLAGAALDVFEGESLVGVDEEMRIIRSANSNNSLLQQAVLLDVLKKLPNVVLTNHNAFNTAEAIERINRVTAENITNFLAGKSQNIVNGL